MCGYKPVAAERAALPALRIPRSRPANRTINPQTVRGSERIRVARATTEAPPLPPEPPAGGGIRQPSWGRIGLEIVTDLIGWLVVLGLLEAIGVAALQKVTGKSLVTELLVVLLLFFAVTILVRVAFLVLARRPPR